MNAIEYAAKVIRQGGVVAYATEYCFGLGCDPFNATAVRRILRIKHRPFYKGLIVVADNQMRLRNIITQLPEAYAEEIKTSWPGPNTWLVPAHSRVSVWVKGRHEQVAVRVSANQTIRQLCRAAAMPIISTSANRAGKAPLRNYRKVVQAFENEVDFVLPSKVGNAKAPSTIRSAVDGQILRG